MKQIELPQQLANDIEAAQELLDLTKQEFQALKERNLACLETILAQKQPLIALLGKHGNQRSELLAAHRLPVDHTGLKALIMMMENREQILSQAEKLAELIEDCRTTNENNGRLIRAGKTAVENMLNVILHGCTESPRLYDKHGSTAKHGWQRPLSQA
ncbi:flagella synthesis protein FlgN [Azomonas macrocytogenes]|uniref:Flagella synthesis protein FlgN n=1 Tax=Azomonas macrocytogenes TaxID=69962 RepID=A0A839T809_AZOMA|nr:flagellar protein FlgN [Azomonas macrocytogenes]MBB3104990.1 flagella synthesis protein FlgN [Azomonas macrocytogenes]